MAQLDISFARRQFTDKRRGVGVDVGGTEATAETNNYDTVAELRSRLTTLNSTSYTTARLEQMTKNDMIYALRLEGDSAGI